MNQTDKDEALCDLVQVLTVTPDRFENLLRRELGEISASLDGVAGAITEAGEVIARSNQAIADALTALIKARRS